MIVFNTEQELELIDDIVHGRNLKATHMYLFGMYEISKEQLSTCQTQVSQIQITLNDTQKLLKQEQTLRSNAESSEAAAKERADKEKSRKKTWRTVAIVEGILIALATVTSIVAN